MVTALKRLEAGEAPVAGAGAHGMQVGYPQNALHQSEAPQA
jgi:hypothetical protein